MSRGQLRTGFLFGLGCLIMAAPLAAQESISEITVIAGGNAGIQPPPGFTKIAVDLNQGAGGAYIYVCYKKGVGAPITGLAVTANIQDPPTDAVYTRVNVDLNQGAGGAYIWLWYTKDPGCGTVHNLAVTVNAGGPADYVHIPNDLNQGAGGDFIYLSYEYY